LGRSALAEADLKMARQALQSMLQGTWVYGHRQSCARRVASPMKLCGSGLSRRQHRCAEVANLPVGSVTDHAQCL